jgi:trehalose 6-phosphate phosphatase
MVRSLPPPPLSILKRGALFLDFDGTLVELAETPDAISVPAELRPLLGRLRERLEGRLAIISGRSIANLESHLDCSGVAVSGSHGLELRLASGERIPLAAPVDLAEPRDEIARFAAEAPGLLVEEKPASIALHYRKAPAEEGRVLGFMSALAARNGLTVQSGKLVAELRPRGADKGDALRALMMEPPFAGARPFFMGDDLTDEDAFEAAALLGGGGILVGGERETAAKWRLGGVAEAAEWLARAAAP